MKIVPTFVPGLYAFHFEGEESDELDRLFDDWNNPVFLEDFFEKEKDDLNYFKVDVETAVLRTMEEAHNLEKLLLNLAQNEFPDGLNKFFKNLVNQRITPGNIEKQKGPFSWLRLYALRIEPNLFVVTGGTIKLTLEMKDRPHTLLELDKLEKCRTYLQQNGVFDNDSYVEFLNENE